MAALMWKTTFSALVRRAVTTEAIWVDSAHDEANPVPGPSAAAIVPGGQHGSGNEQRQSMPEDRSREQDDELLQNAGGGNILGPVCAS
jgi:hypothetical protein